MPFLRLPVKKLETIKMSGAVKLLSNIHYNRLKLLPQTDNSLSRIKLEDQVSISHVLLEKRSSHAELAHDIRELGLGLRIVWYTILFVELLNGLPVVPCCQFPECSCVV